MLEVMTIKGHGIHVSVPIDYLYGGERGLAVPPRNSICPGMLLPRYAGPKAGAIGRVPPPPGHARQMPLR